MSGWVGKRLALLKFKASLNRTSASFNRFKLKRAHAKFFIDIPMLGWFGKRFNFLNFNASRKISSAYFIRFSSYRTQPKLSIEFAI
jgi:hypothetical protein